MKDFVEKIIPATAPHRREWLIQNAKLLRIIMKGVPNATPQRLLAGQLSMKKYRKQRAKQAAEISQQAKKVRELTDKMFKHVLRIHNPKFTNAEYRHWKSRLDAAVDRRIEQNTKQISQQSANQLTNS